MADPTPVPMVVDAAVLARGWLTVYAAAGSDDGRPAMYRTVHVEQYPHGMRLTATDSYMILTTWIPERDHEADPEPGLDEMPEAAAVAIDGYQRAQNLLTHLLKLATAKEAKPIDVRLRLGLPLDVDDDADVGLRFEGMEPQAVTLDHPDHERVQLEVYEGDFPIWRPLVQRFKEQRTAVIALNADLMARLVKVAKLHQPDERLGLHTLRWRFGGADKAAGLDMGSLPSVRGLVMPVRWDFDRDRPWEKPPAGDEDAGEA